MEVCTYIYTLAPRTNVNAIMGGPYRTVAEAEDVRRASLAANPHLGSEFIVIVPREATPGDTVFNLDLGAWEPF